MKQAIKRRLGYRPLDETSAVRDVFSSMASLAGQPVCPPWEGDLIHETLDELSATACLEIGFHTGSTAVYMLNALRERGGSVTSIEPNSEDIRGFETVAAFDPGKAHHEVVAARSDETLPRLLAEGRKFDFVFIDGWKTLDAMFVDAYYATRLLRTGGVLFFDDHHMPSVRKTVRMLRTHYGYRPMRPLPSHAGTGFRLFLGLISGTPHMPFVRIRKTVDDAEAPAARDWNFYTRL